MGSLLDVERTFSAFLMKQQALLGARMSQTPCVATLPPSLPLA